MIKEDLRNMFQKVSRHRLRNYRALKNLGPVNFVVELGSLGELALKVVTFSSAEFKTFTIKIDSRMLEHFKADSLNFDAIDYEDITK